MTFVMRNGPGACCATTHVASMRLDHNDLSTPELTLLGSEESC